MVSHCCFLKDCQSILFIASGMGKKSNVICSHKFIRCHCLCCPKKRAPIKSRESRKVSNSSTDKLINVLSTKDARLEYEWV